MPKSSHPSRSTLRRSAGMTSSASVRYYYMTVDARLRDLIRYLPAVDNVERSLSSPAARGRFADGLQQTGSETTRIEGFEVIGSFSCAGSTPLAVRIHRRINRDVLTTMTWIGRGVHGRSPQKGRGCQAAS